MHVILSNMNASLGAATSFTREHLARRHLDVMVRELEVAVAADAAGRLARDEHDRAAPAEWGPAGDAQHGVHVDLLRSV